MASRFIPEVHHKLMRALKRLLRGLLREERPVDPAWREWGGMKRALADVEIRAERHRRKGDKPSLPRDS